MVDVAGRSDRSADPGLDDANDLDDALAASDQSIDPITDPNPGRRLRGVAVDPDMAALAQLGPNGTRFHKPDRAQPAIDPGFLETRAPSPLVCQASARSANGFWRRTGSVTSSASLRRVVSQQVANDFAHRSTFLGGAISDASMQRARNTDSNARGRLRGGAVKGWPTAPWRPARQVNPLLCLGCQTVQVGIR